ncbi:D-alanyl-D-alanine carboxypeptidase/D-alanyl-D-alanine-endopeptidase [Psittacicella hinzii]|uniref:D-alanyl-D-alanine carboxypeptidase/D-alanyl-D-alanine-endopeptidase n=1 Tax=Psittacicella hinzii TaxID=2028575 RepID=A0A3A1Y3H2_9GAMM|nr:D-alanyl-D-alanine carboxypeptidase/D-alanyl-D-alanine-endopeptidase [Psittacicella hinzii]RIY32115.1 D-alanyl-D-alanine carboxypeptidase/D-alanyl-D-alanine-endopeptidase [Psittacicella hinzii]
MKISSLTQIFSFTMLSLSSLGAINSSYAAFGNASQINLPAINWQSANKGSFNPQQYLSGDVYGIYAVDLDSNQVILSQNATSNFKPASTQKVITSLLTYATFTADHTLKTNVYLQPTSKKGEYQVTLEFTGDPSFNLQRVRQLVQLLKVADVSSISKLVINTSKYNGHDRPQGWVWNGNSMCYSAENSVAQYNYNCISGTLKTEGAIGTFAKLDNYTNSREINITSNVVIVPPREASTCELNYVNANGRSFTLDGCVGQNKNGIWMYFAVPNGNQFTAQVVKNQLVDSGIPVKSLEFSQQPIPQNKTANFAIQSDSISSLISKMLGDSENHIAEQLYRNVALARTGESTSYTLAQKVNSQLLASFNLEVNSKLFDGSGLSYYNSITPLEMTKLVATIYTSAPDLWQLFPNQSEGTLKHKTSFKDFNIKGKTGSLNGVTNFTGVLTTKSGKHIAFTYFLNNSSSTRKQINDFELALLNYLNK